MYRRRPIRGAAAPEGYEIKRPLPRSRKLTDEAVYEARCSAIDGDTHQEIADRVGVSQSSITRAVTGHTFKHVPHALQSPTWRTGIPGARWLPFEEAQAFFLADGRKTVIDVPAMPRVRTPTQLLRLCDQLDEMTGETERRLEAIGAAVTETVRGMLVAAGEGQDYPLPPWPATPPPTPEQLREELARARWDSLVRSMLDGSFTPALASWARTAF